MLVGGAEIEFVQSRASARYCHCFRPLREKYFSLFGSQILILIYISTMKSDFCDNISANLEIRLGNIHSVTLSEEQFEAIDDLVVSFFLFEKSTLLAINLRICREETLV